MILRGWHIDGFGPFRDTQVRDLRPGVIVFHGPNEAGKSTLLAFLRGVLFGYPTKRSGGPVPPLHGGVHGGRVFLAEDDHSGEWTVERLVGKSVAVTRPDGSKGTPEELAELLGRFDEDGFRAVFAFDLSDIQHLEGLEEEKVRDRLFSAGVQGAGVSAREIMNRLAREQEGLLKPRKGGALNDVFTALKETEAALRAKTAEAQRYPALAGEARQADARRERIGAAQKEAAARVRRLTDLVELWPVAEQLQRDEAERQTLADAAGFPENGVARLESAQRDVSHLEGVCRELDEALASLRERLGPLAGDPGWLTFRESARSVADAVSVQEERLSRREAARADRGAAEARFADTLAALGTNWTPERVAAMDAGLERAERVRAWAQEMERLKGDRDNAERALSDAEHALANGREPSGGGFPVDDPETAERALGGLKEALAAFNEARIRAEAAAAHRAALEQLTGTGPKRGLPALALAALGLAALVGGFLLSPPERWYGLGVGLALLIGGAGLWTRRASGAVDGRPLQAARDEERATATRAEALEREVRGAAATLGGDGVPSAAEMAAWERAVEELRALGRAARERDRLSARHAEAAARWTQRWAAWRDELKGWGFVEPDGTASSLTPGSVLQLLTALDAAKREAAGLEALRAQAARLGAETDAWETAAREALAECPEPGDATEGRGLVQHFREALRRADAAFEDRRRAAQLEKEIEAAERSRKTQRELLDNARAEIAALFEAAGAGDEESFRRFGARHARREVLRQTIATGRAALAGRFGSGEAADRRMAELLTGEIDRWRGELHAAEEEARDLETQRDEAVRAHQSAVEARQRLEQASDLAECLAGEQALRARGREAARRWRVAALARQLLRTTLDEYAAAHQPKVLAKASELFAAVTGGRYDRIVQSLGEEDGIEVLRADGTRLEAGQLSRGTREELYVALRLGLAHTFADQRTRLPFIADDVFVNFDPVRARAALAALADYGRAHQALIFTCHPETVERLTDAAPDAAVHALPGPLTPAV